MSDNKKIIDTMDDLASSMEKVVNNDKKPNWWHKNKKVVKGVVNGLGVTVVVIGGGMFIAYAFNMFIEQQHQRFRQEVREEYEKAMAEKQQTADTIAYNAVQNTK